MKFEASSKESDTYVQALVARASTSLSSAISLLLWKGCSDYPTSLKPEGYVPILKKQVTDITTDYPMTNLSTDTSTIPF
jgi:hypothetical protein